MSVLINKLAWRSRLAHLPYKQGVTGSSPVASTKIPRVEFYSWFNAYILKEETPLIRKIKPIIVIILLTVFVLSCLPIAFAK